jgi:hypothetical protein
VNIFKKQEAGNSTVFTIWNSLMAKNRNKKNLDEYQQQHVGLRRKRQTTELIHWLRQQPNQIAKMAEFLTKIPDPSDQQSILNKGKFSIFPLNGEMWVQSIDNESPEVRQMLNEEKKAAAEKRQREQEEKERAIEQAWRDCVLKSMNVARPNGNKSKTPRMLVIARTYTEETAARRLAISPQVVRNAVKGKYLETFTDPENNIRIPAKIIEDIFADWEKFEKLRDYTPLKVREISLVSGLAYSTVRGKLIKAHLSTTEPTWGNVKGQWGLPTTLNEFYEILGERYPAWLAEVLAKEKTLAREAELYSTGLSEQAHSKRERLLQRLFEVFPTWEDYHREEQRMTLHLGPTNSGKTYESLNQLARAGSGWYLAPLRLLAHEVFDTLNKNGILCNLLTGEEVIPVAGATITAATIEMFNPALSGNCVVIDEAHMLSDTQRGWAWTRAIMEARSPEVHIIGAPMVEPLIRRMAAEAGFLLEVESYARLTPLEVTDTHWSLAGLPPKTILVAFSRKVVLALKTELEKNHRRKVSVVYGNLPPEVRLRQAERFARGETEICVATDAIGMGLNLPADNVCFFEVDKFDGTAVRQLNDNEIRQIGGRAGRFGMSEKGRISALNKDGLNVIRRAIQAPVSELQYAHVAPTPESLAVIPGTLSEKLQRWVNLAGIPPKWKAMLKPVDLSNQISLAKMLSHKDVQRMGEEMALLLINAPSNRDVEPYWKECADAIIAGENMPAPFTPLRRIASVRDLEIVERIIRCADIYLWLSQREPFAPYAPEYETIRKSRYDWTMMVDAALQKQIDAARRCRDCGRPLAINSRYDICSRCYSDRRYN